MVPIMCSFLLGVALVQGGQKQDRSQNLDFWVGKWICEGESKGPNGNVQKTKGQYEITKILGGKVIQENFSGPNLKGKSLSVYDANAKVWRQTWVDDSGGYISLSGGPADGKFILSTEMKNGRVRRMVFHDITNEGFIWDWEGSRDCGKTWRNLWHIRYSRDKK